MATKQLVMSSSQIAKVVGTVGSPLIVVAELLKNAVDASATTINIFYNREDKIISVENDHKGFSIDEIETLSTPGASFKKSASNMKNESGMFYTGSKGLGLLSVFLLCDEAEIFTTSVDQKTHKIILNKSNGTVEDFVTDLTFEHYFTRIILKDVDINIIDFLSTETEVRKLRHISTYLYKHENVPFPNMELHISGDAAQRINFSCGFPPMLHDVSFNYIKQDGKLHFQCSSPNKSINNSKVIFTEFNIDNLQKVMLDHYGIKNTILTRTNDLSTSPSDFSDVPSFEGRIVVYEKNLAGAQLKAFGAGVNIFVNEFALYNYLAEENDWLGLADYAFRKKVTRLKPHNVFGFVNFPCFDENIEKLQISNERADFIQDLIFTKLMYLLKGVVMFATFNIDVADKNPKYRVNATSGQNNTTQAGSTAANQSHSDSESNSSRAADADSDETQQSDTSENTGTYTPESSYSPRKYNQECLGFPDTEKAIIDQLIGKDNLSNKIYNIIYELRNLNLNKYQYSPVCLYRVLLESSTKYLSNHLEKSIYINDKLQVSIINALNFYSQTPHRTDPPAKQIDGWREAINKRNLIDILNEYIHNETPVDVHFLLNTWNTMRGYIIACITIHR